MVQLDEVRGWIDRIILDPGGHKVGTVSQIFIDDANNRPEWAAINTGLFGRRSSFVPIEGVRQEGEDLVVQWDRTQVKDAPQVDDDGDGHLTAEEEVQLYRHYANRQGSETEAEENGGAAGRIDGEGARESEQHEVDSGSREQGQTRLRRYVVTEEVHPVSRVLMDDSPAEGAQETSDNR